MRGLSVARLLGASGTPGSRRPSPSAAPSGMAAFARLRGGMYTAAGVRNRNHSTQAGETDEELALYARRLRGIFGGKKFRIGAKSPHFALVTIDKAGWTETGHQELLPSVEDHVRPADSSRKEPLHVQEDAIIKRIRENDGTNYIYVRNPSDHRDRAKHPEATALRALSVLLQVQTDFLNYRAGEGQSSRVGMVGQLIDGTLLGLADQACQRCSCPIA